MGISPEIPLSDIDLEPEAVPQREVLDPYVVDVPFPHAPPGPAENELMGGDAPALLPCVCDQHSDPDTFEESSQVLES